MVFVENVLLLNLLFMQFFLVSLLLTVIIQQVMDSFVKFMAFLIAVMIPHLIFANESDSLLNNAKGEERYGILLDLAYYHLQRNPEATISYGKEALAFARNKGDDLLKMKALNTIGQGYQYSGSMDTALLFINQAYEYASKIGSSKAKAAILYNLGTINTDKGNYRKALENQFASLKLEEMMGNNRGVAISLLEIGSLYYHLNEPDMALNNYLKALDYAQKTGDELMITQVYHNLGIAYNLLGVKDSALVYMSRYIELSKDNGEHLQLAKAYNNIGNLHFELKHYKKAEEYYLKSIEYSDKAKNLKSLPNTYKNLASLYTDIGKFQQAEKYINEAIEICNKIDAKQVLQQCLHQKAIINAATGKYKKAYEVMERHLELKDSIFSENLAQATAEMQTRFETEKKNQEITKQALLIARQEAALRSQWFLVGSILAAVIITILIFVVFFNRYKNRQRERQSELKKRAIETEQRLLRSQMNPHFIFNALMSVQHFISKEDKKTAMMFLSKFSQFIRDILANSRHKTIPLSEELEMLRLYAELEQLRTETAFEFRIESSINTDKEQVYIPPMMVQPFLENAIKHGIRGVKGGFVNVVFDKKHDVICCSLVDNGVGINKTKSKKRGKEKSLAMEIIADRLDVLQEVYGQKLSLLIEDRNLKDNQQSGTQVNITLPFEVD